MGGVEVGAVGEGDCGVRVLVVLGGKGRWHAGLRQIFRLEVGPFHAHARKEGSRWRHGRGGASWYVPWVLWVLVIGRKGRWNAGLKQIFPRVLLFHTHVAQEGRAKVEAWVVWSWVRCVVDEGGGVKGGIGGRGAMRG